MDMIIKNRILTVSKGDALLGTLLKKLYESSLDIDAIAEEILKYAKTIDKKPTDYLMMSSVVHAPFDRNLFKAIKDFRVIGIHLKC